MPVIGAVAILPINPGDLVVVSAGLPPTSTAHTTNSSIIETDFC